MSDYQEKYSINFPNEGNSIMNIQNFRIVDNDNDNGDSMDVYKKYGYIITTNSYSIYIFLYVLAK